jgi:hypothetical protein
MSLPRYKAKRDASEPAIVKALEGMGCSVWRMDTPCDLLVGFAGKNHLAECKSSSSTILGAVKPSGYCVIWTMLRR